MKKFFKFISTGTAGIFLPLVPLLAAATVPDDRGLSKAPGVDITVQSLFGMVAGLACWATRFVMILMVVMIVWYGFRMMAAGDNETSFKNARKSLGYAVVGILVIMGAYTIIATIGNAVEGLGKQDLASKSSKYTMFVPLKCGGY
ncbi:MAG: hypothetical protein UY36_C0005G0014 [Parcubacteria group bacterium GW2011_GWA1_49_11]|uniref:Uncharacterized protein n=1 Tax=Candidatus Yanofskybacteria bacterium RIFCSPHIGHO2_01_FULL_48_25b TaxID=1802672 RepID=A0A1F8F1S8_9BACT|nr:MAG: hypothetical protein UY36_C0005G0014 [Parcubacteria group bacterium GW2011_GWA1_49_11]OGN07075.1 MAG: hypothetical protein A2669_02390 [Candidatus Yanofskybacteria bacterium RIFCSPHIGHO2_01_FULL_48_25b]